MRKSLILSFAILTLGVGLWAENPQGSPAGPIIYNGLHFNLVDNEHVQLVKNKDTGPVPYEGNIVVPDQFDFTDTQAKVYTLMVIWIGDNAFADSPDLTSVTLPTTITKIGNNAFANSTSLKSVTCLGTEPATLGTDVFAGDNALTIYVPIWTKETYQTAWSAYEDLIRLSDLDQAKETALYHILIARQGIQNVEINDIINTAVNGISNATTTDRVTELHSEIATIIGFVQIGKAEALGNMGEPCTDCTAVEVKKGDKTVTLYAPESVTYIKTAE